MHTDRMPSDRFRPRYHFAPQRGWINDPNGLVFHDGEYHLFFQHHPYSADLGPMHWGHAVSHDLVTWTELPVALYPDHNGVIFSGSATVDAGGSAGFGDNALVAVFTSHDDHSHPVERQSLAWSEDRGRTFRKFAGNPVLFPPPDLHDFRDPRVFWYGGDVGGHWGLVLAAGDEVQFYRSDDLKTWAQTGAFGKGYGAHGGVWECPDLFPLSVDGSDELRWVLVVGINPGGQAIGSGTQYFVGTFDGATFIGENSPDTVLWLDWGADAYATQSWDREPTGRRVITSWLNNWHYARETPTVGWRGSMTLPRTLSLRRTAAGIRVCQSPVQEIAHYYGRTINLEDLPLPANQGVAFDAEPMKTFDLDVTLRLDPDVRRCQAILRDDGQSVVTVGWDAATQQVWLDRSASGIVDFHPDFAARHNAPFAPEDGILHLRMLVDANSIELFANQGEAAITDLIYPHDGNWRISLLAEGGGAVASLQLREVEGGLE